MKARVFWKKYPIWYGLAAVMCLVTTARSQDANPPIRVEVYEPSKWPNPLFAHEAAEHAKFLWDKILTQCGSYYYYDGSGLDNVGMTGQPTPFDNGKPEEFTEYKEPAFLVYPSAVLPAVPMTANPAAAADTTMFAKQYRTGSIPGALSLEGGWRDGPLTRATPAEMLTRNGQVSAQLNAGGFVAGAAGIGGMIGVHIEKRGNVWYYRFSGLRGMATERPENELLVSDAMPGTGFSKVVGRGTHGEPVYSSWGAPMQPLRCEALPDPPHPISAVGVDMGRAVTAAEFMQMIPNFVRKAAGDRGLPPDFYGKEMDDLSRILGRCSSYIGPIRYSPLDSMGKAWADCSGKDAIDISREAGDSHGPSDSNDLMLQISWTRGPKYYSSSLAMVISLGIGNRNAPFLPEADIQTVGDPDGPQLWIPPNRGTSDFGLRVPYTSNYQAGPTWVAVGGTVNVQFMLMDRGAPRDSATRVKMVRAPDVNGRPGVWESVASKTINGTSGTFDLNDQPRAAGRYWYGFHLTDGGNREIREPAPLLVRVVTADEIATSPANRPFPGGTNIVLGTPVRPGVPVASSQQTLLNNPPSKSPTVPTQQPGGEPPVGQDEREIVLTHAAPAAAGTTTITAPGMGLEGYSVFLIDTRDFAQGGVLEIQIQIDHHSGTDGSFDLFPAGIPIPTRGRPVGTLTGSYDVHRGTSTQIRYRFARGQVFAFGLEGNWFSPKGATGTVRFQSSVHQ